MVLLPGTSQTDCHTSKKHICCLQSEMRGLFLRGLRVTSWSHEETPPDSARCSSPGTCSRRIHAPYLNIELVPIYHSIHPVCSLLIEHTIVEPAVFFRGRSCVSTHIFEQKLHMQFALDEPVSALVPTSRAVRTQRVKEACSRGLGKKATSLLNDSELEIPTRTWPLSSR